MPQIPRKSRVQILKNVSPHLELSEDIPINHSTSFTVFVLSCIICMSPLPFITHSLLLSTPFYYPPPSIPTPFYLPPIQSKKLQLMVGDLLYMYAGMVCFQLLQVLLVPAFTNGNTNHTNTNVNAINVPIMCPY